MVATVARRLQLAAGPRSRWRRRTAFTTARALRGWPRSLRGQNAGCEFLRLLDRSHGPVVASAGLLLADLHDDLVGRRDEVVNTSEGAAVVRPGLGWVRPLPSLRTTSIE